MAWPNPFRGETPNERDAWGYRFELTDQHLKPEQYEPLKHSYDTLGEQVLDRLNEISPPSAELPRNHSRLPPTKDDSNKGEAPKTAPKRDLYAILRDNAESDELLGRFWTDVNTVPEWVDWEQIARGQDVFYRYGGANLTGLAYQSLLGGMGAARVVETLGRTGGFSTKVARGRLFETTQHVLQCTRSLASIQPGGEGFASTIRVRLLHAAVRKRILKLAESRPDYYNVQEWGVPINDLDSVATITTFSSSLVWLSLPRQGIFVRQQEVADYIALWRYIAHVIGCPTKGFFEDPSQSKRIFESLMLYEIEPSATSQVLANNIIQCLQDQPPGFASADFLTAGARWLNGNKLADALGLPRPGLYYWMLMAGQCIFFWFWSYIYRAVPSWDRKNIEMLRKAFWMIMVESKYGLKGEPTNFDFKYVPEYSTITEMGEGQKAQVKYKGVEGRNLKTLAIATVVTGIGMWCSFQMAGGGDDERGTEGKGPRVRLEMMHLHNRRKIAPRTLNARRIISRLMNEFQVDVHTNLSQINNMQTVQRCNCSVRALELFVRDFAGLEMRQNSARRPVYRQSRKPASSSRWFGTRPGLGIQQPFTQRTNATSTAPNIDEALETISAAVEPSGEDAQVGTREAALAMTASQDGVQPNLTVDSVLLPRYQTPTTHIDTTQQRLDILGPSKTRTDGRKERKTRRIEAKKAAEEEAKRQLTEAKQAIESAKRKQRRETAKKNAAKLLPQAKAAAAAAAAAAEEKVKWQPREEWMRQKAALQDKFGEQKWQPRKRISPDALSGIRTMHNQQPHVYTTEVLAEHFKVSAEAIRRILKSKWQPDEEATDDRRRRWEKRGEKKWKEMVELGIRPPKKWREMGVGKVGPGEVPAWKKGGHKTGAAGERWIEHPEADSFVMAGDMASERTETEPSIGDRIL